MQEKLLGEGGSTPAHRAAATGQPGAPIAVAEIRVMNEQGGFGAPTRVHWGGGQFEFGGEPEAADLDGRGLFLTPGLVDAHAHVAWHAFDAADRDELTRSEQDAATLNVLQLMLREGFTRVRDAGGLRPSLLRHFGAAGRAGAAGAGVAGTGSGEFRLPATQTSVALIGRAEADAQGGVLLAAETALSQGARWVKLVGTASVASPPGSGLEPVFSAAEQRDVVRLAAEVGAGVMLHAWGGQAIDDAIDAGVMSIEHGIFLTREQASRAAEHGMTLVPTLKIYKLVQAMIAAGSLPAAFARRVDEAVSAHPHAVRIARDAGLPIALGSDFSTPEQHGTNRTEFDELVRAGLSAEEALVAATRAGAALLDRVEQGGAVQGGAVQGGAVQGGAGGLNDVRGSADPHPVMQDAVIFDRDPREPGAFSAQGSVIAVVQNGVLHDLTERPVDTYPTD